MEQVTFSVLFYLRTQRINKDGRYAVICRITVNGIRAEFPTRQTAFTIQWDVKSNKLKGNSEEAKKINFALEQIKSRLIEIYNQLRLDGKNISSKQMRAKFLGLDEEKTPC